MLSDDFHRFLSIFKGFHGFRWVAGLARLAGRSALLLGFVARRLEPWSPTRSTLGEVGGLIPWNHY